MVEKPELYKWSSYLEIAWDRAGMVVPHDEYLKLGVDDELRQHACRKLFRHAISSDDIHTIESAARYCRPAADNRFCERIASRYGIEIPRPGRGRPRKEESG